MEGLGRWFLVVCLDGLVGNEVSKLGHLIPIYKSLAVSKPSPNTKKTPRLAIPT